MSRTFTSRSLLLALGSLVALGACVATPEELSSTTQGLCDGEDYYWDEETQSWNVCIYPDDPPPVDDDPPPPSDCDIWPALCDDGGGNDDGNDDGGGGDGGGGDPPPPPPPPEEGSCYSKLFSARRVGTAGAQDAARVAAIEAARGAAREQCRQDSYYVGYFAYCDQGQPDSDPWTNGNSFVYGCWQSSQYTWTCDAYSAINCRNYTYHAW